MALLGWVPWEGIKMESRPMFVRNESGIFESRTVAVKILQSPSIFLMGMENSILGVWVAHSEGRCFWPDERILNLAVNSGQNLAPIRFVDDYGKETQEYPYNPNGSMMGITAICSRNGRHLVMMPHPERPFLAWQWSYWPEGWSDIKVSPWLRLFQNARNWCEETA